jgi:hypothetical protein
MNGRARPMLLVALLAASPAAAQITNTPTPAPIVTADNASWYLSGTPITYAGNFYYPSGPQVYFNPNEMIRSAFYEGVPLYTQTTIEPYSIVYVPLAHGLMQPYERRRSGDVAGTSGSITSRYPVLPAFTGATTEGVQPQAAAPPSTVPPVLLPQPAPAPQASIGATASAPQPAATTGRLAPRSAPVRSVDRPQGLNAIFVEYDNARWYSAGRPVPLDRDGVALVGEYHGFPVYRAANDSRTIYIPVTAGADSVAPYTRRKRAEAGR